MQPSTAGFERIDLGTEGGALANIWSREPMPCDADLRFDGVLGPFRLPRAAVDFPNAASELTGSTTERCGVSSVIQCVRGVFVVDSDTKRRKNSVLAPLHPAAAATNNLMTDLYSANEISGLWPGLWPQVPKTR